MKKGNKWIIIIAVAVASVFCSYLLFSNPDCESEPCEVCECEECEECTDNWDITLIESGIREMSKLTTAEYYFKKEIYVSDDKKFSDWWDKLPDIIVPGSGKHYTYEYTGYVDAYILFDQISVSESLGKIKIKVPHAKLDEVNITQYDFKDEKESLINKISDEERDQMFEQVRKEEYNNAIESGIEKTAEENAEKQITNFLKMLGDKISKYEIEIIFY